MTRIPAPKPGPDGRCRLRVIARGAVQGVGFRPFVYRLATNLGLAGGVRNTTDGLCIEVEGSTQALAAFERALNTESPPAAVISGITFEWVPAEGASAFEIWASVAGGSRTTVLLPDLATCADCRREIFDPDNRRFRYPFTNCTQCGPRFSIVLSIPYDRVRTTMRSFSMCSRCVAEYEDPYDRRFHAQPNACPECGPQLALWNARGQSLAERDAALRAAADSVRAGQIVAIKGLGGFQLVVKASDDAAVRRLRDAKRRETKPLALMAPHLDWVRRACQVSAAEEALLTSPQSPIVLLERRAACTEVAPSVAPGNPNLGVMLPYTPLHHLLMGDLGIAVVATSGNRSDEPICTDEGDALRRLEGIADLLLVHDRPIARPIDDGVVRVILGEEQVLRRARGYAPLPVALARPLPTLLAVGAHLKSTVALALGSSVFLGSHVGDLETPEAVASHRLACNDLPHLYGCAPVATACDLHPDYASTHLAHELGRPVVAVQHHHAHVVACMAENGFAGRALGVAWDGTGLGPDGTVWGGEFLLADAASFERYAHLRAFRLPGGEAAIREPRRAALGVLHVLLGAALWEHEELAPLRTFDAVARDVVARMLATGLNAQWTSSAGRLFDAVAAILDLHQVARFEGQAAMALEFALAGVETDASYPFEFCRADPAGPWVVDWAPLIEAILADVGRGESSGFVSARFHNTLVEVIVAAARRANEACVALSGGCFQNRYLTERTVGRLQAEGFRVLRHRLVPPNDGGVALGQLVVAAARLEKE